MKTINKKSVAALSLLVALSVTLFSFSTPKGGEGFEIYIGSKLVLQKFGDKMNDVKSLQLDQHSSSDQLIIKYYHCGRTGKNRTITLKDDHNKVVKEWSFSDVSGSASMSCSVKDILNLKKGNSSNTYNLYYTSSELPKGRLLTSIVLGSQSVAKL
jgi:hypothetical protein